MLLTFQQNSLPYVAVFFDFIFTMQEYIICTLVFQFIIYPYEKDIPSTTSVNNFLS